MSLRGIAEETLKILEEKRYTAPSGQERSLATTLEAAVAGARLYPPGSLALPPMEQSLERPTAMVVEVTDETTQLAALRLAREREDPPLLLNFASAFNPGGGFLNGAKAQEEDLARCSGLYPCLQTQPAYYAANRALDSMLYTDHIIYAPGVPFFRINSRTFLEEPFCAGIVTAPAPNAGQALRRDPGAGEAIAAALRRRAGLVLAIARETGHRRLVLGAWGCGVFGNDPVMVAGCFADWLRQAIFREAFDHVVFAIMVNRKTRHNLDAFAACYADWTKP